MILGWDHIYNILKNKLGREPTNNEVQTRMSETRKLCVICLFDKPLTEFEGEICKVCKKEAEAAGVKI